MYIYTVRLTRNLYSRGTRTRILDARTRVCEYSTSRVRVLDLSSASTRLVECEYSIGRARVRLRLFFEVKAYDNDWQKKARLVPISSARVVEFAYSCFRVRVLELSSASTRVLECEYTKSRVVEGARSCTRATRSSLERSRSRLEYKFRVSRTVHVCASCVMCDV